MWILVQPEALVPSPTLLPLIYLGGWLRDYGCSVILVAGFLMVTNHQCITVFSMPIIKEAVFSDRSIVQNPCSDTPSHTHITGQSVQRKRIHHFLSLVDISILC